MWEAMGAVRTVMEVILQGTNSLGFVGEAMARASRNKLSESESEAWDRMDRILELISIEEPSPSVS